MCVVCNHCSRVYLCKTGKTFVEKDRFGYECPVNLQLVARCTRCPV